MKKGLLFALLAGVLLNGVFAHDWFAALGETKAYNSGDNVPVYVYSTHHLFVGESIPDRRGNTFYVLQNNTLVDTRVTAAPDEALKVLKASFTLPSGASSIVVVNRNPSFSAITTSGSYRSGTKVTLKALGLTVSKASYSEGWCKIYVNPASNDSSFSKPLGLPLEIVPVTNPADIALGKAAVFKVLLNGQALPNAGISATYKKYKPNEEDAWAVKDIKTDARGQVSINIPNTRDARDLWIVKAAHTRAAGNNPNYDEENFTSLVSFNVTK
ncbi:MAG: DUF4198 domain-containing protein [Spirochaetaceae bacterium]|nr:DUF4198 domain-containing protein [Spirochaetaceae bacterium]